MEAIESWFSQWGMGGQVLFVFAYVLVTMLPVPTAPFTLAGGAMFGFATGFVVVAIATLIGSTAAFFLGRHGLKGPLERRLRTHPNIDSLRKALVDDGWKAVLLFQLSPALPFGVQNFFLGATGVKLRPYLLGTTLGMLPSTAMYLFVGSSGRALLQDAGPGKWSLVVMGIAATLILSWRLSKVAKRRLQQSR
jgi:uncharacterized membrane protein YdjX (TVP38/TMEM64 family)